MPVYADAAADEATGPCVPVVEHASVFVAGGVLGAAAPIWHCLLPHVVCGVQPPDQERLVVQSVVATDVDAHAQAKCAGI